MWEKVRGYLDDPSSYTSAPGVTNKSCMLVKSASGTKPHFVQRSGKSKYKCDGDCLMFKSTNGICSHTHFLGQPLMMRFPCLSATTQSVKHLLTMHSLLSMDYL